MNPVIRKDLTQEVKKSSYPIKSFEGFDSLSPERALPLSWCNYGYNVTVGDGRVTSGPGIREARFDGSLLPNALSVGSRMVKAAVFKGATENVLVALMQNKKLYYANFSDAGFTDANITFGNREVTFLPYHYDNKDVLLVIGSDGQMFVFDGATFAEVPDAPHMTTACVFNERVYGTVTEGTNRLYFSDDLDPTNWHVSLTEGGYVDFVDEGGKVTGVIGFKSNLYIFREYSVHKLSAYIDQTDYVMTKVYSGHDRIYFASARVVDNKLIFLTEEGFLYTDGSTVKRIFERINPLIQNRENVISGCYGYNYLLSCGIKKDNNVVGDESNQDQINNGVFLYDFATGKQTIMRGMDVGQFLPVSTDGGYVLLVLFGSLYRGFRVGEIDDSGKLFGSPLKKLWRSPFTDFGLSDKDKVVRRVFVTTSHAINLSLKLDKTSVHVLGGSPYAQVVPVKQKGHKIGLEVSTTGDTFALTDITLEMDLVRRDPSALVL